VRNTDGVIGADQAVRPCLVSGIGGSIMRCASCVLLAWANGAKGSGHWASRGSSVDPFRICEINQVIYRLRQKSSAPLVRSVMLCVESRSIFQVRPYNEPVIPMGIYLNECLPVLTSSNIGPL
jgi:hypothetical protein